MYHETMIAIEIPHINQVFIQPHTGTQIPVDMLPHREEIAHPSKILAACQSSANDWDPFLYEDGTLLFQRTWITWRKQYDIDHQRISTNGFYILCEDSDLFTSVLQVNGDDVPSILEWLQTWGKHYAIVTTPLCVQATPTNTQMYGIPNDVNIHPFPVLPFFDMTEQFIQQSGYTIISGFTIAIALHRLNIWSTDIFQEAIMQWFQTISLDEPWVTATPQNANLFFQHPIAHICDHPLHYAIMGKDKADIRVVKTMKRWMHPWMDDPMTLFQVQNITYYTTLMSTMFPHYTTPYWKLFAKKWRRAPSFFQEEEDDGTMETTNTCADIGSFIVAITSNRHRWNWWECNAPNYMHMFMSPDIDATLKRIFYLYSNAKSYGVRHSRLRKLWKQIMKSLTARKLYVIALRVMLISCTHLRVMDIGNTDYWRYEVPIAFMKDLRTLMGNTFRMDDKHLFTIVYHDRHHDIMQSIFGKHVNPNSSIPIQHPTRTHFQQMQVSLSLFDLIRSFPVGTTMHHYANIIERDIAKALWTLKRGFYHRDDDIDQNKYYTLWMILETHMRDHIDGWI